MAFAPAAANLDWAKLGLAVTDIVNGHVECRYDATTGKWLAPTFVRDPYLRVHGLAPGLNYGQQVYEGLKASRNQNEEILLFRADRHASRMAHSAHFVSIPSVPEELFLDSVRLAVGENAEFVPPYASNAALYIRPLAFGSGGHFALTPPREYLFCVFVQPFVTYHGSGAADALVIDEFDRAAPRGTGSAKVGGNYAPVMRFTDKARAEGFPLTLHLDSKTQTEIDEFSTSSFIGIRAGNDTVPPTLVVPDSKAAIESVTSDSTVALAKTWGWTVEKRPVLYNSLSDFTEIIAAGTAAALVPIHSITRRSTGDKFTFESGPLCQKLSTYLRKIQRGETDDFAHWIEVLQPPETVYKKYKSAELPSYTNGNTHHVEGTDK